MAWQALAPLAVLVTAIAFDKLFALDQWLADQLFWWEGGHWLLRNTFATETVIHQGGKIFSLLLWLSAVLALVWSCYDARVRAWRLPLAYLVVSVLLATAGVAWIKSWSNMDCPWDLLRYGGERPYVGLFDVRPVGLARGRCFPAAHASAGYAWVALYYFFQSTRPSWRWAGLGFGLALGAVFGIAQQLRGAHFLSHDLCALALCWGMASALYAAMSASGEKQAYGNAQAVP